MALEPPRVVRLPERWFEIISTALGLTVAGALAWFAAQIVAMRDDIHTVKDQLPAVSSRLDHVEHRLDSLEDRVMDAGRPPH
jgi:hypothetical protein